MVIQLFLNSGCFPNRALILDNLARVSTEKSEQEEYILQGENGQSVQFLQWDTFLFYKKKLATALGSYSWLILNSRSRDFKCDSYENDDSSEVVHLTVNGLIKTEFNMNGLISRGRIFKIFFFPSKFLKKQPLPVSAYKIQVN